MTEGRSPEHEHEDAALARRLAALPVPDVDETAAESIRRRARNLLAHQRRLAGRPWLARANRIYTRYLEPTLVAAAVSVYLGWAFQTILSMHP